MDLKCPIAFPGSFAPDLWVVDAAILGFAVAVVVYAYQVLGRQGPFSDDLAVASGFPATVNAGLASIFLLGISLAHEWDGAAWLTLFAVALSSVWFLFLTQSFRDATRAASPGFRIGIRQRRLGRLTTSLVRQQVRNRLAGTVLEEELVRSGLSNSFWVFLAGDDQEDQIFRADRDGRLTDIDLVRLSRVGKICKEAGLSLQLALRFDSSIAAGTPLARADGPLPSLVRRLLDQALVTRPERQLESIAVEVSRLRDEALLAMGPTTTVLDEVLVAYESMLTAFALAWHEYVDELTADYVHEPFALDTPVATVSRSVFDLMERAIEMDARDSAMAIAYFPVRILRQAVASRASAFAQFLDLYISYYAATSRTTARTDIKELVRDRCWRHMIEAMNYILPAAAVRAPRGTPEASYTAGLAAIGPRLISVLKLMVDAQDKVNFEECLRNWRHAERDDRDSGQPDAYAAFSSSVALGWVIARRYRAGALSDPRWWLERVIGRDDAATVISAVDRQLETNSIDLNYWALMELPSGEAHYIDTNSDLVRSLIYSLLIGSPSGVAAAFDIGPGLYGIRTRFRELVTESMDASTSLDADLRVSDVLGRLTAIQVAFNEAVSRRERAERDRIRAASIDPQIVADFARAILKARDEGFPRRILEGWAAVHRGGRAFAILPLMGLATLEDKKLVVPSDGVEPDGHFFGEAFGQSLARGELRALLDGLSALPARHWRQSTVSGRIAKALDRLRQTGLEPNLILIPSSWRLWRTLESEGHFLRSPHEEAREAIGSFDNIPGWRPDPAVKVTTA